MRSQHARLDDGAVTGEAAGFRGSGAEMPRDATARTLVALALAMTLALSSCSNGSEPAAATGDASSLPPVAVPSVTVAPRDAVADAEELASHGLFDISRSDLSLRDGPSGTTVRADFSATARQAIQIFELDYCGPPVVFLSVDGSTVEATRHEGILRARLHAPLQADDDFGFRFLTIVPRDEAAQRDLRDVTAELFCR